MGDATEGTQTSRYSPACPGQQQDGQKAHQTTVHSPAPVAISCREPSLPAAPCALVRTGLATQSEPAVYFVSCSRGDARVRAPETNKSPGEARPQVKYHALRPVLQVAAMSLTAYLPQYIGNRTVVGPGGASSSRLGSARPYGWMGWSLEWTWSKRPPFYFAVFREQVLARELQLSTRGHRFRQAFIL